MGLHKHGDVTNKSHPSTSTHHRSHSKIHSSFCKYKTSPSKRQRQKNWLVHSSLDMDNTAGPLLCFFCPIKEKKKRRRDRIIKELLIIWDARIFINLIIFSCLPCHETLNFIVKKLILSNWGGVLIYNWRT